MHLHDPTIGEFAVVVAHEIHHLVTEGRQRRIRPRGQRHIRAAAGRAEHEMLAREGAVELQVDRGRTLSDLQNLACGVEDRLVSLRGKIRNVERVAQCKAIGGKRMTLHRQRRLGRIRRPLGTGSKHQRREILELCAQGDRGAAGLSPESASMSLTEALATTRPLNTAPGSTLSVPAAAPNFTASPIAPFVLPRPSAPPAIVPEVVSVAPLSRTPAPPAPPHRHCPRRPHRP